MDYPKTLAAARAVENYQWALGDALNEECKRKDCSVAAAHRYLVTNGLDAEAFNVSYLEMLRRISRNFPEDTRSSDISFSTHQEARNPETLEKVKAALPAGKKPTVDAVRAFRDAPVRRPSPPPITAPENEVRAIISQMLNWRDKWMQADFHDAHSAHLRDLWVEAMNTARLIMNDFDPAFKPAVIEGGKSVA